MSVHQACSLLAFAPPLPSRLPQLTKNPDGYRCGAELELWGGPGVSRLPLRRAISAQEASGRLNSQSLAPLASCAPVCSGSIYLHKDRGAPMAAGPAVSAAASTRTTLCAEPAVRPTVGCPPCCQWSPSSSCRCHFAWPLNPVGGPCSGTTTRPLASAAATQLRGGSMAA